jgi:hypothetical protein
MSLEGKNDDRGQELAINFRDSHKSSTAPRLAPRLRPIDELTLELANSPKGLSEMPRVGFIHWSSHVFLLLGVLLTDCIVVEYQLSDQRHPGQARYCPGIFSVPEGNDDNDNKDALDHELDHEHDHELVWPGLFSSATAALYPF